MVKSTSTKFKVTVVIRSDFVQILPTSDIYKVYELCQNCDFILETGKTTGLLYGLLDLRQVSKIFSSLNY